LTAETTSLELTPVSTPESYFSKRVLLGIAAVFLFVNFLAIYVLRGENRPDFWLNFIAWVMCAFLGDTILNRYLPNHDSLLFPITMFLTGWGLLLIERLAPNFADRQGIWLIVSVGAMLLVAILPRALRWLRNFRYVFLLLGLILLVSTIVFGRNPSDPLRETNAPQLWLGIGSIFFQPSEALKIILVAFLASYLAETYPTMRGRGHEAERHRLPFSPRVLGPVLLMWGISVVILIWQRDLGTAILFFAVFLVLLYIASGYGLILVSGAILIVIAAVVAYQLFDVVQLRVDIWINPWPEANGRAFQIVQSLLAFAAGGTFGQGIGQGSPTYIPVVHSDFVFAALAEEWGLLGVVVLLACFAIYIARGLRSALRQQRRPFLALLAVGLSTLIATQSLLIMTGVLKLLPLTGVTLPFISYGGSSLLASFVITGLLLRLSALESDDAILPRN
jgi:cell division protein FtsW (lipid II flippase)